MSFSSATSSPASSRPSSSHSSLRSSPPSSTSSEGELPAQITRWIIDTRSIWPGEKIQDSASEYLALISDVERKNVLRKYHVADAKMALASALLKRAYIAKATGLAWTDIKFTRRGHPVHGKPCWSPPSYHPGHEWPQLDFNVSHQAGLATLVGICVRGGNARNEGEDAVLVGCDIVAPGERPDLDMIRSSDFEDFTATFNEIFSDDELWDITYNVPSGAVCLNNGTSLSSEVLGRLDRTIICDQDLKVQVNGRVEDLSSDLIIDAKLRTFYAHWSLKEAYIKLVGEGLLAPWIKECEFRRVHPPTPGAVARCSTDGSWGGKVTGGRSFIKQAKAKHRNVIIPEEDEEMEIWLNGEEIHDVITEVQAFEEEFMIATMIRPSAALGPKAEFPPWEKCNLERDILQVAVMGATMSAIENAYKTDIERMASEMYIETLPAKGLTSTITSLKSADSIVDRYPLLQLADVYLRPDVASVYV